MGDSDPGHQRKRGVVLEVRAVGSFSNNAAVAVVGVLAGADIGNDYHLRQPFLDLPDGPLDDAVRCIGFGRLAVFCGRDTKEDHRPDTGVLETLAVVGDPVHRVAELPRHRGDG